MKTVRLLLKIIGCILIGWFTASFGYLIFIFIWEDLEFTWYSTGLLIGATSLIILCGIVYILKFLDLFR